MVQVAEGPTQPDRKCPYSGETIVECKRSDICDCWDFPEYDERLASSESENGCDRGNDEVDNASDEEYLSKIQRDPS